MLLKTSLILSLGLMLSFTHTPKKNLSNNRSSKPTAEQHVKLIAIPEAGGLLRGIDFKNNRSDVLAAEKKINDLNTPLELNENNDILFYTIYLPWDEGPYQNLWYTFEDKELVEIYLEISIDGKTYAEEIKNAWVTHFTNYYNQQPYENEGWHIFKVENEHENYIAGVKLKLEEGVYKISIQIKEM